MRKLPTYVLIVAAICPFAAAPNPSIFPRARRERTYHLLQTIGRAPSVYCGNGEYCYEPSYYCVRASQPYQLDGHFDTCPGHVHECHPNGYAHSACTDQSGGLCPYGYYCSRFHSHDCILNGVRECQFDGDCRANETCSRRTITQGVLNTTYGVCALPGIAQCEEYDSFDPHRTCADWEGYNYLSSYGKPYSQRFFERGSEFSDAGKATINCTAKCLLHAMRSTILNGKAIPKPFGPTWSDPRAEFICKAVQEAAFASHVGCYTKCGFCKLSASDWAHYGAVIDLQDLDANAVAKTAWACRHDIVGKVPEAWLSMNLFAQDIFTDILLVGMIMALL